MNQIVPHKSNLQEHVNGILEVYGTPLKKIITRLRNEGIVTNKWIAETSFKDKGFISRELNMLNNNLGVTPDVMHMWWEKYPHLTFEEFAEEVRNES